MKQGTCKEQHIGHLHDLKGLISTEVHFLFLPKQGETPKDVGNTSGVTFVHHSSSDTGPTKYNSLFKSE